MDSSTTWSVSETTTSAHSDSTLTVFKYPAAEADNRISSWIQQSSSARMTAPSETHSDDQSNLGDSAYEFIDTDSESRDGATESIASTDFGRPEDEVASLAGTEQTDDEAESEASHAHHTIPTFTGLDDLADTPVAGQSTAVFEDDVDKPLIRSIEFDEPLNLGAENVSVKHTITEFNEEQTAIIAGRMMLHSPPPRMVAAICQTMTRQGLSIAEPLRLLYVGSPHAKQDIIHKIASSVAASVGNDIRSGSGGHRPAQIFNVVPVTAFGSQKAPEVDLIESSGYQIKVDDCLSAVNLKFDDDLDKPDMIKLTLEDNFSYLSVPDEGGFNVEPSWELPHVAIIYCSDNDTAEMRRTRTFAKTFMSRHRVPVIVISHKQLFDKSMGCMSLDQHAIHMCLESRDPNGPRNIIHQRLPIDLASFMNIDARQMNRNLAFLTGLHEPLKPNVAAAAAKTSTSISSDIEKTSYSLSDSVNFLRARTGAEWRALLPVGVLVISVLATVLTGINYNYRAAPSSAVSINGALTQTSPMSAIPTTESLAQSVSSASLSTATETRTATKTITVTHAQSVIPNGLSVLPPKAMSKLREETQLPVNAKATEVADITVEVLGEREILIRMPSARKLSWLAKEAMSINVTRSDESVETERVYSSNDGIILQFPKNEAYGVLNISIVTTKKPKVNETFAVDFGNSWRNEWDETIGKWSAGAYSAFLNEFQQRFEQMRELANQTVTQAQAILSNNDTRNRIEKAQRQALRSANLLFERAQGISRDIFKRRANLSRDIEEVNERFVKELNSRAERLNDHLQSLHSPVRDFVLHSQIMSKLAWLRIQGREEEAEEYKNKAKEFFRRKLNSYHAGKREKGEAKRGCKGKHRRSCGAKGRKV